MWSFAKLVDGVKFNNYFLYIIEILGIKSNLEIMVTWEHHYIQPLFVYYRAIHTWNSV